MSDWVFGYASLVTDAGSGGVVARLPGYRRFWGVATDNSTAIPGYKMYTSRKDGSRPVVGVAFLDIELSPGSVVNGVARRVAANELPGLDRRERNYDRIDVSEAIEGVEGRVWTYRGTTEGRARLAAARESGTAVVSRGYAQSVRAGFHALGSEEEALFEATSDLEGLPLWDLDRVDLPSGAPAPAKVNP